VLRGESMLEQVSGRDIWTGALTTVMAVLAFFGKRELKRLDEKPSKEAFDAMLQRLDEHIADDKAMRAELSDGLAQMNKTLTETQISLAHIAGSIGK